MSTSFWLEKNVSGVNLPFGSSVKKSLHEETKDMEAVSTQPNNILNFIVLLNY